MANDFSYVPATQLADRIKRKYMSPVELMEWTLGRIEELNPKLGAYITVMGDQAMAEAKRAEQAVMDGAPLGPLHGLPAPIKDLEAVKGVRLTHGCVPDDETATSDSLCVERIRAAGGIVIGKTNTPEYGHAGTTENRVFGPCRNPWDTARTSGGSSGGAGASVAAGITAIAQGSDGGGSVRIPAALCGIFGLKATQGRIPRRHAGSHNIINNSSVGPMSWTVRDSAMLANVLAGPAPDAEYGTITDAPPDFTSGLEKGVKGLRIGLDTSSLGGAACDPAVSDAARKAAAVFEHLGAHVEEVEFAPEEHSEIERHFLDFFCVSGYYRFGRLLDNRATAAQLTDYFRSNLERGRSLSSAEYMESLDATGLYRHYTNNFFASHDLLLMPTLATGAFEIDNPPKWIDGKPVRDPRWGFIAYTYIFNLTGNPAASVPCGFDGSGMPVGLQVIGDMRDEVTVLAASAAFEEARPWSGKTPSLD
jgi:Asp-tRNA(Asn)/Glu-tRNA(Gln) amidotransferase A subunit family amidase